ncbi:MAG TPA: hypothetical protein VGK73_03035 [Polyangiaceae bacterium]
MANRIYTVEFENVTVTNAGGDQELFALTAADDKPIELVGMHLAQFSDLQDAAEEVLRFRVIRGHATISSGGAAPTPRPAKPNDAAAGFTSRTNDTTIASTGTPVNLVSFGMNIRTPSDYWFPQDCEPGTDQTAGILVVRLMAGPTDDVVMSGTLWVREK